MGMIINVYRAVDRDYTNGGVSSKHSCLTVINVDGPFNPQPERAAVILDHHVKGCLRLVPASPINGIPDEHLMMGGNYGATSDSRFSEACEKLLGHRFYGAVAIHDRVE